MNNTPNREPRPTAANVWFARAELKAKLEKLHADGVVFAACENTMKREKIEKKDLVELTTTVDSGVSEVIRKQEEGFAYIKSGG